MAAVSGDSRGFYRLLGVARTASPEEVRAAFRDRAKVYHPDIGAGADDERFRQLREAYEVLRDPQRRQRYDAEELDAERFRDRAGGDAGGEGRSARPPALGRAGWAAAGVAAALALALAGVSALAVGRGGEVARLRAELASTAPAAAPRPGRALAADGAGAGPEEVLYTASFAFPPGSAEFEGGLAAQLEARLDELRGAIAELPGDGGWSVVIDGRSARAASEDGVAVEAWELTLLRVATLTEFLVRSAVPAERVAVRFLAGGAVPAGAVPPDDGRTVEVRLMCCRP